MEIYTHNTPGAPELHLAAKQRHSITFYMIAGGAADNGRATMSFCVTDKCLIWLTQPTSVFEEWRRAHGDTHDSYAIETLCCSNNRAVPFPEKTPSSVHDVMPMTGGGCLGCTNWGEG